MTTEQSYYLKYKFINKLIQELTDEVNDDSTLKRKKNTTIYILYLYLYLYLGCKTGVNVL
jgi:hypothetical protein